MLREHAARQAQEQREEAEQRRLDAAQFEREVRRHPGGAWLPPPPDHGARATMCSTSSVTPQDGGTR